MGRVGAVNRAQEARGHLGIVLADGAGPKYPAAAMETKLKGARRRTKKQFVVDEKGRRTAVLLPIEEYDRLVEAKEDLADIRAADEARAEGGEPIPWEQVKEELRAAGKLP